MDVLLCKKNYRADKSSLRGWGEASKRFLFEAWNITSHLGKKVLQ